MTQKIQKRTFDGGFHVGNGRERTDYIMIFSIFPEKGDGGGWFRPKQKGEITNLDQAPREKLRTEPQAFAWLRNKLAELLDCKPADIVFDGRFRDTSFTQ